MRITILKSMVFSGCQQVAFSGVSERVSLKKNAMLFPKKEVVSVSPRCITRRVGLSVLSFFRLDADNVLNPDKSAAKDPRTAPAPTPATESDDWQSEDCNLCLDSSIQIENSGLCADAEEALARLEGGSGPGAVAPQPGAGAGGCPAIDAFSGGFATDDPVFNELNYWRIPLPDLDLEPLCEGLGAVVDGEGAAPLVGQGGEGPEMACPPLDQETEANSTTDDVQVCPFIWFLLSCFCLFVCLFVYS